ncbi:sacsin N-terminal ATP-binding-like domain-containing protein [Cellulomonas sp. PSBB021]|uniref:sacsin N-terminal ATP-binding-like domain-containing protein n=1 Tax=Cellulomonas sp. PSBB021 TaxID=2003551 RepID=UPI000B8DB49E|nr:ATP-binding protein [Cellulomonas sp. PSBB021]ASR56421.1 ATP-binding protein [Cellulomonas sp. PSBB021]
MSPDAFGTAALRAAVLTAWRTSPARLREDANVEEDHARGYYRDRVVVELAQNAADAAVRAGVPGRLLLRLTRTDEGTTLVAANTGAPLDEEGVAALASMRASAKRGHAGVVGRFGVGFAAVRAVSDEISVLSSSGAVRFSLRDAATELATLAAEVPALAQELVRRDGSLPALRLPFAAQGRPPEGFDTAVVLLLRDEVAADEVRALLHAVDDALLLALPGLTEVVVEDETSDGGPRRIADVAARWFVAAAEGDVPRDVLAGRPVEERDATRWRVTWALPRSAAVPREGADAFAVAAAGAAGPRTVHAPTPTDEPLDVPALLVATLPLDPTRRHVATGPLTDRVLRHAADVYADLALELAEHGVDPLTLVPTALPAGPLDAALRPLLLDALAAAPVLTAAGSPERVAPRHAVAVVGAGPPEALAAVGRRVGALVVVPAGRHAQARAVGVEVRTLADVVEELPAADDDWRGLYTALGELAAGDPEGVEALANLPVPLADGRVVRGVRGALVLAGPLTEAVTPVLGTLARWGVRVVDPAVAHPLLERLGAQCPDAVGLLRLPPVRAAVLAWDEDDDPDEPDLTTTVLTLVAAHLPPRDPARWSATTGAADALPDDVREWLALLPLTAAGGEPAPADGLVLPGSPAHRVLDARVLAPVASEQVERWGAMTLVAAGVREGLVTVRVPDVVTDEEPVPDAPGALTAQVLDAWPQYLEHLADVLGPGAYVGDVTAVADLDAVATEAWPQVLAQLCEEPDLRRAVLEPVRGEHGASAASYTAWWLRERGPLGVEGPFVVGDGPLRALLPAAPPAVAPLDVAVQRALGGVSDPRDVTPAAWADVLDAWAVGAQVPARAAALVWRHAEPDEPPERVPAVVGPGRVLVVAAHDAAVAPSPMWRQRTDVAALVPARDGADALRLSRALDLPRVSELAAGVVTRDDGLRARVPRAVRDVLPGAPEHWCEHEDLRVDHVSVAWWVDAAGDEVRVHATTLAGLAAALAQAAGRWDLRYAVEAVLVDDERAAQVTLDVALDD